MFVDNRNVRHDSTILNRQKLVFQCIPVNVQVILMYSWCDELNYMAFL